MSALMRIAKLPILLTTLMALGACAGNGADEAEPVPYVELPVETIYRRAAMEMDDGNYRMAAAFFNEVERQHPYSNWATRAKLMAAYAHYQGLRYEEAIEALDRFIQIHPGNPDIAYAYYLRAISYYEQITDVSRDQQMTRLALNALEDVVRRFPETPYARDSQLKIDLTRDHLAGKEMEIGRFYLRRGHTGAAIKRFQVVVEDYDTTSHTPEALHRLVEAYLRLGLSNEAVQAAATLGHNYPDSRWYRDSYRLVAEGRDVAIDAPGFFGRVWNSLF